MQTVETLNEGLRRQYTLKISAREIDAKVEAEVRKAAPQVRMPGFRPGKVPANLIRKMHGPALTQDALNSSIQEGVQQLISDQRLRPATQPSVALNAYAPGQDVEVAVELEVLPDVPAPTIDNIALERLSVPVDETQVDAQLKQFAGQQKKWDDAPEGYAAAQGDLVVMDFAGTVDGVAFEGGTGTDMSIEIGSGRLIPGFEDQLVGAVPGDEREVSVTFPEDYPTAELTGKDAVFACSVTAVRVAGETVIDDELAKSLGLEGLDQLRDLLRSQIEQELNGLTRTHMKRKLLDQLAAGHDFDVPPSMVEAEFTQIWQQLEHEAEHEADPAQALAEMESERDDYRRIAERRVRLGLLLSEIGTANGVQISQAEMNRLVAQAAQQYRPEDQQRFAEYIRNEPMAAAQLRAPLYEDKVVDFLFEQASITDREVTREELEAAIESEDGFATGTHVHNHDDHDHGQHDHAHDHDHHDHSEAPPPKPKRKAKAKIAATDDAAVGAEPLKVAPTRAAPSEDDPAPVSPAAGEATAGPPAKKAPTRRAKKAAPVPGEADEAGTTEAEPQA